jgi:carbamoyl-phosphate synthase / aspartate carbamoyltransferase
VDLVELATKAMIGAPVRKVLQDDIHLGCVGVKVPMFSFERLTGADPGKCSIATARG